MIGIGVTAKMSIGGIMLLNNVCPIQEVLKEQR